MIDVSNEYKVAMAQRIRKRGYTRVVLGVFNQFAQEGAKIVESEQAPWSNATSLFEDKTLSNEYATMEHNFFRADGTMALMGELWQYRDTGYITNALSGSVKIQFDMKYDIKGITIDFGSVYPTRLRIITDIGSTDYTNSSSGEWSTDYHFGEIEYMIIQPLSMVGGDQRMHIRKIKMGQAITFDNSLISNLTVSRQVATISEEIPSDSLSVQIIDVENKYNVDSKDSFINFFNTRQAIDTYYGQTLDDDSIEWLHISRTYLTNWSSAQNKVSISGRDVFSFMEDVYTKGDRIYNRTAYAEAEAILQDAGFTVEEYSIDDSLKNISLINPLPTSTHKEALQVLCNATRCIFFQDPEGVVRIKPNFERVIEPEDIEVLATGEAFWSRKDAVKEGSISPYADMSFNMFTTDGTMIFLPPNTSDIQNTGYYTSEIAKADGTFDVNPTLGLKFEASYKYYSLHLYFGSRPPAEMIIRTYNGDELQDTVNVTDITKTMTVTYDFKPFDKVIVEFTKAIPNARIMVQKMTTGDVSDYTLSKNEMTNSLQGTKEERTKDIYVSYASYEIRYDEEGQVVINPDTGYPYYDMVGTKQYAHKHLNNTGVNNYLDNPLIATSEYAMEIANWIGNHFNNDISYNVSMRGEPRLQPCDLIFLENDNVDNLIVEINSISYTFNGGINATLDMRRALKMSDSIYELRKNLRMFSL